MTQVADASLHREAATKPAEDRASHETHVLPKSLQPEHQSIKRQLALAAHDIRAPIHVADQLVAAVRQRLQHHSSAGSDELRMLGIATERLREAARWTEQILSAPYQASRSAEPRVFHPVSWKDEIAPLLREVARDYGIRILWLGWKQALPSLYLDRDELSRAVLNLVENACKATPSGGQISVRAVFSVDQDDRFEIHVEDQGPGLAGGAARQNAATGQQTDSPSVSRGLGLGIVAASMRKAGGRFVMGQLAGGGASMQLVLPLPDLRGLIRAGLSQLDPFTHCEPESRCHAYGLRLGVPPLHAHALGELQQCFLQADFVHHVGRNRWILFQIVDSAGRPSQKDLFDRWQHHKWKQWSPANQSPRFALLARSRELAPQGTVPSVRPEVGCLKTKVQIQQIAEDLFQKLQGALELGTRRTAAVTPHQAASGIRPVTIRDESIPGSLSISKRRIDHSQTTHTPYADRRQSLSPDLNEAISHPSQLNGASTAWASSLSDLANCWKSTQHHLRQSLPKLEALH
ncbi:MAG: sensor histidine kinase [bacterium]|nr:sensor histidine kinase [bacterium]